ncbi:MAG: hypothetical protein ACRCZB_04185 [Bacteroidales bacterium]
MKKKTSHLAEIFLQKSPFRAAPLMQNLSPKERYRQASLPKEYESKQLPFDRIEEAQT